MDALSRYLQGKDIDVITAKGTADAVVLTQSGCCNEENFKLFWESVGKMVSKIKEGSTTQIFCLEMQECRKESHLNDSKLW